MPSDLVRRLPTPSPVVRVAMIGGGAVGFMAISGILAWVCLAICIYGIAKG